MLGLLQLPSTPMTSFPARTRVTSTSRCGREVGLDFQPGTAIMKSRAKGKRGCPNDESSTGPSQKLMSILELAFAMDNAFSSVRKE